MHKKELLNYIPLVPNIEKPYAELSEKEAEAYLAWFVSHIDVRSNYIKEIISVGLNIPNDLLDFSLESLKIVWKWFLTVAETTKYKRTKTKGDKLFDSVKTFIEYFVHDVGPDFTVQTHYIIRDIGMYVAKVFLYNYPILKWSIKTKPKNYVSVNEQLIIGFVDDNPMYPKPFFPEIEPISFVHSCAFNIFDGTQHEDDLYNQCLHYVKWIPKT